MINRNAKDLILLSRSGANSVAIRAFLEDIRGHGIRVEAPACDVTDTRVMQDVLGRLIQEMSPIKGCVQGSMVGRVSIYLVLP